MKGIDETISYRRTRYEQIQENTVKKHDYLGMVLDYELK